VFAVSFPSAVDRFITLWEIAGEVREDPILREATDALKAGSGVAAGADGKAIAEANKELLTLHEVIAHRLVQILLGLHRGRRFVM
jgi:xylose isomerase